MSCTAEMILEATAILAHTQAADPLTKDGIGFNNADFPLGLTLAAAGAIAPAAALLFCYPDQLGAYGLTRDDLLEFLPKETAEKGRSEARRVMSEARAQVAGKVAFAKVGEDEVLFNGVRLDAFTVDSLKRLGAKRTTTGYTIKATKINALKGLIGEDKFIDVTGLDAIASQHEQVTTATATGVAPKKSGFTIKIKNLAGNLYLDWEYAKNNATFDAIKDIVKPMSSGFNSGIGWLVTPNQLVMVAMTLVEEGLEGVDISALLPHSNCTDEKILDLRDEIRSGSLKVKVWKHDEKTISLFIRKYDSVFVEACKSVRGRYNGEPTKSWTISKGDLPKVIATLLNYSRFDLSLLDEHIVESVKAMPAAEPVKIEGIEQTPTGCKLFPHQIGDVEFLLQDFASMGVKGGLLANDMGLGKTLSSMYAAHIKCPAGRKLVVVPSVAKENWQREIKRFLGEDQTVQIVMGRTDKIGDAKWVVINYDIISYYKQALIDAKFSYVIMDEVHMCFPQGTRVVTSEGLMCIEDIVEGKKGVSVASFNFSTHGMEWKSVVDWIKTPLLNRMLRVTHEHGSFLCTEDHQVWTEGGYREARSLQSGEVLCVVQHDVYHALEGGFDRSLLLQKVCQPGEGQQAGGGGADLVCTDKAPCGESMREVRGYLQPASQREELGAKALLHSPMLGTLAVVITGAEGGLQSRDSLCPAPLEGEEVPLDLRADACGQPYVGPRSAGAGTGGQTWADIPGPRREREADATSDAPSASPWISASRGVLSQDQPREGSVPLATPCLLSGPCRPHETGSHRSGWGHPQIEEVEVSGRTEDRGFEGSRVVRVEILESGDPGEPGSCGFPDQFVYCLGVADNDNFFAEGVLVHNCKNLKAQRTQALVSYWDAKNQIMVPGITDSIPNVLPMSGTPMLNRPNELFPLLRALGHNLGKSKNKYEERYCGGEFITVNKFGKQVWTATGATHSDELAAKVSPFFRKLYKKDCLNLPPKIRTAIPVEVSAADKKRFNALFDLMEVTEATDDEGNPTGEILKLINTLKYETAKVKVAASIEQAEGIVAAGEKVIIFTSYTDILNEIVARFGDKAVFVDGSVTGTKRTAAMDAFQNDEKIQVFVGNTKACGVAITLTAASHVIFNDREWTPGLIEQAEDRAYRIGQTKMVNVYHMTAEGTFDEELVAALDGKSTLIFGWEAAAISGEGAEQAEAPTSVRKALFDYIKTRKQAA